MTMDTKQITVTIETTPLEIEEAWKVVQSRSVNVPMMLIDKLRSALKAEQKPVEPKEIILGPDTPLGWYKVIDCKERGHENGACELKGQPFQLYKVDKSGGWFSRGGLVDLGATLLPVEPKDGGIAAYEAVFHPKPTSEPAQGERDEDGYIETARDYLQDKLQVLWHEKDERSLAALLCEADAQGYARGRSDLKRVVEQAMEGG